MRIADRKIVEEDDDYLSANKLFKNSSEFFTKVSKNFSYMFRTDEDEIKRNQKFMQNAKGEDVVWLRNRIEDIRKTQTLIRQLIDMVPAATEQQLKTLYQRDLSEIKLPQRWRMYKAWRLKAIEVLQDRSVKIEESFQQNHSRLKDVRDFESAEMCLESDVVGFTTTGAAKQRALLNHLNSRIGKIEFETFLRNIFYVYFN